MNEVRVFNMSEQEPVKSPCISVCVLNEEDVCEGCYRTALEITDWVMYSNDEKREVLGECKKRFKAMNKHILL
ncbi:DUF1289 domain-containing protein [Dasania sp. GY-MA-18]|uniref:DUF1289 domain-containing protein n=1 Tax=Dasania phycosphaerae TaxID=2950436 RepID=A0A9J6RL32_9GAMM|nr:MULTISPECIES: DUF1289 domain-containing protein [Dasania]MCR8922702.1 DUF1289 domain-containing protein [Dasania sp. GY-MA-18]MCZ0865132.1 DUF1289 domain-containing protein [Dasania phycosphaerae]MCZ0868858.1 DUF1289 domain-containing protein [Dasania phycosphaerae]